MFVNGLKIFFGIAILVAAFDCGFSLITAFVGLLGLYLILSGITGIFMWLGSLSKNSSNPHLPQNPV
jgi:hypothetical protein